MIEKKYSYFFVAGWGAGSAVWNALAGDAAEFLAWNDILSGRADIASTIKASEKPVVLVGWSLGGMLALESLLNDSQAADKVARLILISSAARMCGDENYIGADSRAIKAMRLRLRKNVDAVMSDFAANCFGGGGIDNDFAQQYLNMANSFDAGELKAGLDYLLETDLRGSLEKINCNIEIIHGTDDKIIPFACAEFMAENIKNAKLHKIGSGPHGLPLTAAEQLRSIISEDK